MKRSLACCCVLLSLFNNSARAIELADGFKVEPSARYRYQDVNDNLRGDGEASTLKVRISADWQLSDNWQGFGQFDYVHAFNESSFNSVTVERATSPIPDPPGEELNQLFLRYQSEGDWDVTLGRQSIGLDNERHVGKIEFWQNDQTFDTLRFHYRDNVNWTLNYLYLNKAHRFFGDDAKLQFSEEDLRFESGELRRRSQLGNHDHNSHLLNLNYAFDRQLSLTLYAYLLDNKSARIFSSNTYGARLVGELKPAKVKYGYVLEYANQANSNDSPWNFNADYWYIEGSAQFKSHQFSLTFEKLGEDNGFGFATSLGTNHKFQGWADVFSNYLSRGGLEDLHATYRGRAGKLRWRAVLHQFDSGQVTAGHELDIEIAYRYNRDWEFKFIGARYFADEGFSSLPASQQDLTTWMVSAAYNL